MVITFRVLIICVLDSTIYVLDFCLLDFYFIALDYMRSRFEEVPPEFNSKTKGLGSSSGTYLWGPMAISSSCAPSIVKTEYLKQKYFRKFALKTVNSL